MSKVYIIAEAGVNHNGDIELAKTMMREAKKAGADAVKFQTFKAENLVSNHAPKAEYQLKSTDAAESQKEMLKKLELSYEDFEELSKFAKEIQIDFLSTPFDEESIEFLNTLDMRYWKVPSGEITNLPYLIKLKETKKPIILSTGMSTLEEIRETMEVFSCYEKGYITLLHCTTEYPTPYQDVNLNAMITLRDEFSTEVGYSDHTIGIEVPVAAVAMGAAVIEKHFTLDRTMEGPDHKASLEVEELAMMVKSIRNIEQALGDGEKKPSESEKPNIIIARKSIVAKVDIKAGELLTEENMTTKRPGSGITPMEWFRVLGTRAVKDFVKDEPLMKE